MTNSPPVSVLLAVHNDARYIAATLRSILAQTMRDFELVVVDDASTDGTADILRSTGDPRVRYFRNVANVGQVTSMNHGLTLCRGELVARIDGDDLCEPERFEAQVRYLRQHPSLAGCATWTTEIDSEGNVITALEPPADPDHVRWSMCHVLRLYHPSMMIRRAAYERAGGYDVAYPATEDYELWTRMVASGDRLGIVPRRLIRYRRREGSLSSKHAERQRDVGRAIATRYIGQMLGNRCEESVVGTMRQLLSWTPIDAASLSSGEVRDALRLMRAIRRAALHFAASEARAAADAEVASHLLRHGRLLLSTKPTLAARLGLYVARLPSHRRSGMALIAEAARCTAGRTMT